MLIYTNIVIKVKVKLKIILKIDYRRVLLGDL